MTSSWRIFDFVHIAPPCHCNLTEMRFDFAVCDCCCFLGIKSRCIDFNVSFFSCTTNNFNANLRLHEISNYHESLSPRHNLTPQSALPGSCHVPLCQVISTHRYKNEIWEITSFKSKKTQKKTSSPKHLHARSSLKGDLSITTNVECALTTFIFETQGEPTLCDIYWRRKSNTGIETLGVLSPWTQSLQQGYSILYANVSEKRTS